jgi:hypothetical protein
MGDCDGKWLGADDLVANAMAGARGRLIAHVGIQIPRTLHHRSVVDDGWEWSALLPPAHAGGARLPAPLQRISAASA